MNNVIAQTRLDVLYPNRANLMNTYNFGLQDIIESITGKGSVSTWPQNQDSYVITFDPKRRCEMIFAVQAQLSELGIAFDTFGTYAPRLANWAGYQEIDPAVMEGVEQRTKTIRADYASLVRVVKQANQIAWQIGQMLYQQREVVAHNKHGGFEGWLAAEFPDLHIKKAERFINIYQSYPNIDIMSRLDVGLTVLYKLSAPSTPESARAEIEQLAEQGQKVTVAQAAEIIASHKLPDSENDLDFSDFTEADFEELNQADGENKPLETGIAGYVYAVGGKEVIHESTGRVLSLAQFEVIKAQKAQAAPKAKPSRKSDGSGGGHKRTASQIQGERIAAGMVAQVERANAPRNFMVRELGKLSEDALTLLAAAVAASEGDSREIRNQVAYIADFVMKYGGSHAK